MTGEPLAGGFGDGIEQGQEICRGHHGDMTHRSRQGGESGLNVQTGLIPALEDMDSMGVPKIMYAGWLSGGGPDTCATEELSQTETEPWAGPGTEPSERAHE